MRQLGVEEWLVSAVMSMYTGAKTVVRTVYGNKNSFEAKTVMHQGSALTHTHTQPFYGSVEFVRDNPGEPVPEEIFTHYTHRSHQSSLSAFSIYYDTWHPPYSIHALYSLFPQSLSKFSLVYLWQYGSKKERPTVCHY